MVTTKTNPKRSTRKNPARCYRCDAARVVGYDLLVDGAQQRLTVKGRKLNHAHVRCSNNHEWWSHARQILAASRAADAQGQPVTLPHLDT